MDKGVYREQDVKLRLTGKLPFVESSLMLRQISWCGCKTCRGQERTVLVSTRRHWAGSPNLSEMDTLA